MAEPHVDVLVVNYLTGELAAQAGGLVAGPQTHVYVLDNSGDVSEEAIADFGGTLVRSPRNVFYAAGNNALYGRCDGEFVLLLNPDVCCAPEALSSLVLALESDPLAWAAVPRLLNEDGSDQDYYRRLPTTASLLSDRISPLRRVLTNAWRRYLYAELDPSVSQQVEAPPAACLLVRRSAVGRRLFDEDFPLFFNDTDLARRMLLTGRHALLVPDAQVVHLRGASLAAARRKRPYSISLSYDRSARRYAKRAGLRGWPLITVVTTLREVLTLFLSMAHKGKPRA